MHKQKYVQFSGGSNAQSSILQFFDLILGIEHHPTQDKKQTELVGKQGKKHIPPVNFIHDMRRYMPGAHARFLEQIGRIANIRDFVRARPEQSELTLAFDAALAMLSAMRDKHIQMVSRYIVIQSKSVREDDVHASKSTPKINLATRPKVDMDGKKNKSLKGTGGSSLIAFLRQARDETGQPAVQDWARDLLSKKKKTIPTKLPFPELEHRNEPERQGLSGTWTLEEDGGGLCYA